MTYKEIMAKTGVNISGIVKEISVYIQKNTEKRFYTAILDINGSDPAKIKLPDGFPLESLPIHELVKVPCRLKPSYDKKNQELEAVFHPA